MLGRDYLYINGPIPKSQAVHPFEAERTERFPAILSSFRIHMKQMKSIKAEFRLPTRGICMSTAIRESYFCIHNIIIFSVSSPLARPSFHSKFLHAIRKPFNRIICLTLITTPICTQRQPNHTPTTIHRIHRALIGINIIRTARNWAAIHSKEPFRSITLEWRG